MQTVRALVASAVGVAGLLLPSVQGHGYMLLPETKFTTDYKNYYAYVVPSTDVPPESDYWTGDAEKNSANFKTNYATLNPSSLREFILQYQVVSTEDERPAGGTPECGFSIPDADPQPLPDHIEYGNYAKDIIHPGPCEAWCDDEIVVAFAEDCRIYQGIDIPYDEDKCVGKSRLTFYWLATHFAPFQVYISCVPLEGSTNSSSASTASTSTTSVATTSSSTVGFEALTSSETESPTASTAAASADSSESANGSDELGECTLRKKKV